MAPRRDRSAAAVLASVAVLLFAGCVGFDRAFVDPSVLTGGWEETDTGGGERWLGLAAKWAHVTYEVRPAGNQPFDTGPYPASLTVMSIQTPGRLDRAETSAKLEAQVQQNAAAQDLHLDEASRTTGERTTRAGGATLYFAYDATIGSGSGLFAAGREARVIGEVWYDEANKITVLAVGLAQVQGGGVSGQHFINDQNWARIVADPDGTIEGLTGTDGLVYNTRSKGS